MRVLQSQNPAKDLAADLQHSIENATTEQILCFAAGGSALAIFEYIELSEKNACRTIFCMGDERVSGAANINNFLQLQSKLQEAGKTYQIIETKPTNAQIENPKQLANEISNQIKLYIEAKPTTIIGIFAVGTDGHTAGIFPNDQEAFITTFADSTNPFVANHHADDATATERITLHPEWILNTIDEVLGYATGTEKCLGSISELQNTDKPIHEMPSQLIKQHSHSTLYTDCIHQK